MSCSVDMRRICTHFQAPSFQGFFFSSPLLPIPELRSLISNAVSSLIFCLLFSLRHVKWKEPQEKSWSTMLHYVQFHSFRSLASSKFCLYSHYPQMSSGISWLIGLLLFAVLSVKPKASLILGKHYTTELHLQPLFYYCCCFLFFVFIKKEQRYKFWSLNNLINFLFCHPLQPPKFYLWLGLLCAWKLIFFSNSYVLIVKGLERRCTKNTKVLEPPFYFI